MPAKLPKFTAIELVEYAKRTKTIDVENSRDRDLLGKRAGSRGYGQLPKSWYNHKNNV